MSLQRPCGGCGAQPGQPHEDGCDVARCLWTGRQLAQCEHGMIAEAVRALQDHGDDELAGRLADWAGLDDWMHDCGSDVWAGEWPGNADCRRLGWWSYFGPEVDGTAGWQPCTPDHPGAGEDLNRLIRDARWDRATQRWEAS